MTSCPYIFERCFESHREIQSRGLPFVTIHRIARNLSRLALVLALGAALAPAANAETIYRRGAAGDAATLDPQKTSTVPESDVLLDP